MHRCPIIGKMLATKRTMSSVPWKMNDYYYNYQYTSKMNFIDHQIRFPIFRVLGREGDIVSPEYDTLGKDILMPALELMVLAREMDSVFHFAAKAGHIIHYMVGKYEEAISVGAGFALSKTDALFLQNREFALGLQRGFTPSDFINSFKGNISDGSLGKCHFAVLCDKKLNVYPPSVPLGNRNPHAVGSGYYFRVKGMNKVALCVFGEGAASEGDVHASMNFASTLGAQTLFLCRNNGFALSTYLEDQYAGDGVAPRGIGYGMPAIKVDGNDFLAVYYTIQKAREMIMERKGPVLVEAYSYRGGDNSTNDTASLYRTKDKMGRVNKYRDQMGDPILRLAKYMKKKGIIEYPAITITELEDKFRVQCLESLNAAKDIKMAPIDTMFEGVYHKEFWNIKEQREQLKAHLKKFPEGYPLDQFSS